MRSWLRAFQVKNFYKEKKGGESGLEKRKDSTGDEEQAQGGELPCPALAWGPDGREGAQSRGRRGPALPSVEAQTG